MDGSARPRGRQRMRGWWAVIVMVPVLLACGASTVFKPPPAATLASGIAPFEVVTLDANALHARDGRDGRALWQQTVVSASDDTPHSSGGALLAADGIVFYRPLGSEVVDAFAAESGVLLWRLSECPGYDGAMTVSERLFFVTCGANAPSTPDTLSSDTLYALDAATGRVRWQARGEHFRAVAGDLVITQTPAGLAARGLAQGDPRWSRVLALASQVPTNAGDPLSSAFDVEIIAANGVLYVSPNGLYVVALRVTDGSTLWESIPFAYLAIGSVPGALSPHFVVVAATASSVIAHTDTATGYGVVALDAVTGSVRWHIADGSPGSSLVSLVGPDGAIFVYYFVHPNDPSQTMLRLDPDTGAALWSARGLGTPLWYAGGALYTNDEGGLLALASWDGRQLFEDPGFLATELAATADVVGVAARGDLYLLSAVDGKNIWFVRGAGDLLAAPIIIPMSG